MDSEYYQRLENEIDRELKELPEFSAPASLVGGVMARIAARPALPWYRQSWQSWPEPARVVSFVGLAALFGGICFGGWELWQLCPAILAAGTLAGWAAQLGAIWDAIRILAVTAVAVVRNLGTGFMIACIMVALSSYFACVGLGTVVFRFAFARARARGNLL